MPVPISISNVFKFSGYSEKRRIAIYTFLIILLFAAIGFVLFKQVIKGFEEKEIILIESARLANKRADKAEANDSVKTAWIFNHLAEDIKLADSSANDFQKFIDEIKVKKNE